MEDSELIALGKAVLNCEADTIKTATSRVGESCAKAIREILSHKGKLMVSGVGKSGLVGQKIAATLSSTGTPAVFMHACDAVHYPVKRSDKEDDPKHYRQVDHQGEDERNGAV